MYTNWGNTGGEGTAQGTLGTHVNESGGSQEKMILLELLRVNNAEISSATPLRVAAVGTFELDFISLGEVSHGTLKFGQDGARGEATGGKNTELRFAREMRIPLGVGDLNGASWEVELHVAGRMAAFEKGVGCGQRGGAQDGEGETNVAKEFVSRSVKPLVK
jgi:hypothetical protein